MSNMVPIASPKSGAGIDLNALKIIKKFQPNVLQKPSAFDIESFFEFNLENLTGVKADYRHLPYGIHGFTDSDKKICIISTSLMDSNRKHDRFYARSTIAHEVSHAVEHVLQFRRKKALLRSIHDDDHASLKMYRQIDIPLYQNPEWQAWRHAGAILMPKDMFTKLVAEGASEREIADVFEINPAFVRTRAKALKIILK